MSTRLHDYQTMCCALEQRLENGDLPLEQALQYQELLYRIEVLNTCRILCRTAPVTMDISAMVRHYQAADAYIQCISEERRSGAPADEKQAARCETASGALSRTLEDWRKRFATFQPTNPEQYRQAIGAYINTVLSVWLQLRGAYTTLEP